MQIFWEKTARRTIFIQKNKIFAPERTPESAFFWQKYIENDYFDSIFWSWHDSSISMIKFDPSRYFWSKMGSLGLVLHKINPLHVKRTTFVWKLIFSHPNEPRKSVFFTQTYIENAFSDFIFWFLTWFYPRINSQLNFERSFIWKTAKISIFVRKIRFSHANVPPKSTFFSPKYMENGYFDFIFRFFICFYPRKNS